MKDIILPEVRHIAKTIGTEIFHGLIMLPQTIRKDKERTGIQVLLRVPLDIGNLITFPVGKPSERAQFLASKKSITTELYADATSQNHEDYTKEMYPGCVTFSLPSGKLLHCSISGLLAPEDATCAIIIISRVLNIKILEAINDITMRKGKIPHEIFQENHYLKKLIDTYRKQ